MFSSLHGRAHFVGNITIHRGTNGSFRNVNEHMARGMCFTRCGLGQYLLRSVSHHDLEALLHSAVLRATGLERNRNPDFSTGSSPWQFR
ncbi:hypothetical protein PgNI_11240, partial [Pyricularia grisea]|uniref:Uncharacterized protein n=1 Tax=Pyricularia grisea TaxID=148305 RepID=A0A6P8APA3_PYRGI